MIGLNAASFVQKEKVADTEFSPNRSSYNTGATGTRAFYDLLAETGRKITRWQEPPSALLTAGGNRPNTFVIIGSIRREFEENEIKTLLEWVKSGGKLVVIDREPSAELLKTTANWNISAIPEVRELGFGIDPSDQKQMTDKIIAAKPVQPTVYTSNVNGVQPSRFASTVTLERSLNSPSNNKTDSEIGDGTSQNMPMIKRTPTPRVSDSNKNQPNAMPKPSVLPTTETSGDLAEMSAPVVHLSNNEKILLIDFPFGNGKIVFLTDPYIVSNGGLSLVDNAQLGINIVAAGDGIIAFDEYHHGYGAEHNRLFAYFAGTPVIPIFLQCITLIAVIMFSQSRRFARALPEREPNRLSKLEYVSAMAELQQRTKGYDLAIENIYTDFRRRVARLVGVDNFATQRTEIAQRIVERLPSENFNEIDEVMRKCEYISQGEPTNKKEVLRLASRLREIEDKLGLKRTRRQTFGKK